MKYKIGLIIGAIVVLGVLLGAIFFGTNSNSSPAKNTETGKVSSVVIQPDCTVSPVAPTADVPNPLSACDLPTFEVPSGWAKKELVNPLVINIDLSSPEKNLYGAPNAKISILVMAERADFTVESEADSETRANEAYKRLLKQKNEDVRDTRINISKQPITISGIAGYVVEVDNVLLEENPYHSKTIYLSKDGNVYSFSASAPKEKWSEYESTIDAAFASIKF